MASIGGTGRECSAVGIESDRPADLADLYELTHAATEEINGLQGEFEAAGSELVTEAREISRPGLRIPPRVS